MIDLAETPKDNRLYGGLGAKRYRDDLLGDWSGPATHLAEESARLAALQWANFSAKRIGSTLGAEISGVDLRNDLSEDVIAELAQALADYKVIFFRDQPISGEQHLAFTRRFGELEVHPFIPANAELPELVRFAKGAEAAGYENSWHHDVTWREIPSKATILHALEIPEVGGDTLFSDMGAAYDALEDEIKGQIDGLVAVHDFSLSFARAVPPEKLEETRAKYPLVEHPVVVRHPVTGRRTLYVNRNFTSRIVGLDEEESTRLLVMLCRQAAMVEHQIRFVWQKDSIAMWDNLGVQHYASSDYWPQVRVMERASIRGTRPVA